LMIYDLPFVSLIFLYSFKDCKYRPFILIFKRDFKIVP
jgi:hypothetical protein